MKAKNVTPTPIAQRFPALAVFASASLSLLSGCASSEKFTKLRVTDYRGGTLAEYTARGPIRSVEGGYAITAVERTSGAPHRILSKYPEGWKTTVLGPRIYHWIAEKPAWLEEREAVEE